MPNGRDYAILIGIRDYTENQQLHGPHKDAIDFKDWLTDLNLGNVPEENIGIFLSTPSYTPSQLEIDRWFKSVFENIQNGLRGRRLYFYFSGHGIGVNASNSAMLLPEWSSIMRDFALSSEKYIKKLEQRASFEEVYFFMDCCRNRIPGVEGQGPTWGAAGNAQASSEHLVYYASEYANPAFENPIDQSVNLDNQLPRGLFTEVILQGLKGAAAGTDGWVTVQTLVNYTKYFLPELAKSAGKSQFPRTEIKIDLEKRIVGPFPKKVTVNIHFNTNADIEMILEDPNLDEVRVGKTSDKTWTLNLSRGKYILRKKEENEGMTFYNNGIKTEFTYE